MNRIPPLFAQLNRIHTPQRLNADYEVRVTAKAPDGEGTFFESVTANTPEEAKQKAVQRHTKHGYTAQADTVTEQPNKG